MTAIQPTEGRYAYEGLNRIIHERSRLSILTSLFARPCGHSFNELKKLCDLTDGNLSRQITRLKEAKLLKVPKGYQNNKPITTCTLTRHGREKFRDYLAELEKVVKDAAAVRKQTSARDTDPLPA